MALLQILQLSKKDSQDCFLNPLIILIRMETATEAGRSTVWTNGSLEIGVKSDCFGI